MSSSKSRKEAFLQIIFATLSGLLILLCILYNYNPFFTNAIAVMCILLSFYLCYIYRYNVGLFIVMVFIAYTNYSIAIAVYINPKIRPEEYYSQFSSNKTLAVGIICIFIFVVIMVLLSSNILKNPQVINFDNSANINNCEPNKIVEFAAPIVYLVIFFLNFNIGEDGARGGSTALGEYRIIVAIIGGYYSEKNKKNKIVWTTIISFTSILIFMSKNRVDAFPSIILLLVYWFPAMFDYKKIIMLLPFAVVFFASIGFFRGAANGIETVRIVDTISEMKDQGFTYRGAVFAYIPALATVELSSLIPLSEKLDMLKNHIVYVLIPVSWGEKNPDLSLWSRNYYSHWAGFISPIYFYFWFGYLGAIAFSFLVNLYKNIYIKYLKKRCAVFKEKVMYVLSLYFVCNVARWYEYGPMPLLRGMFICFLGFSIVYCFKNLITKKTYTVL